MKEEVIIRETLKDFKTISDSDCIYELSSQDCKILLDYITNLQEENEILNNIIKEAKKIFEDNYYKENTTDINEVIFFGMKNNISGLMYEKLKEGEYNGTMD